MFFNSMGKLKTTRLIRKAVDSYPGGLCFATPGGSPILVNYRMNQLVCSLTGHTVMGVNSTWEELERGCVQPGCRLLGDTEPGEAEQSLTYLLPDGSAWQFQRKLLTEEEPVTVQISAADVSELYRTGQALQENNRQLTLMHQRQQALLENIVEVNRKKELLSAKMRIHDKLGQCLLETQMALSEPENQRDMDAIAAEWRETLQALQNIPEEAHEFISPETELLQVARMVGCDIVFEGNRPVRRTESLLFYAAVREALTNAVRHADADRLFVTTEEKESSWEVTIRDNGKHATGEVAEGVGLSSLRKRLEQEGATLTMTCDPGVVMNVNILKHKEENG